MSEIQSVEGRPLKKGISPGRRSAYGALALLIAALAIVVVGQLVQPPAIPLDHSIAVIRTDGTVALARTDGSAAAPLAGSGVPQDAAWVLWAPGGDFVTLRTPGAVVVVDRAGVVSWRKAVAGASVTVAWAPDGSRVAIFDAAGGVSSNGATRASLQVMTSTGALEWDVPLPDGFGVVPGFGNLAWSPDGSSLAFTGFTKPGLIGGFQPTGLWIAAVPSETLDALPHDGNTFLSSPAWAGDGDLYVVSTSFEETGIWRTDPASGSTTLVLRRQMDSCAAGATCAFEPIGPIEPSPDAASLAFRDASGALAIVAVGTRTVLPVPKGGMVPAGPYRWAADGASLLFLDHADPPADPSVPKRLTQLDVANGALRVLLDDVRAFDLLASGL